MWFVQLINWLFDIIICSGWSVRLRSSSYLMVVCLIDAHSRSSIVVSHLPRNEVNQTIDMINKQSMWWFHSVVMHLIWLMMCLIKFSVVDYQIKHITNQTRSVLFDWLIDRISSCILDHCSTMMKELIRQNPSASWHKGMMLLPVQIDHSNMFMWTNQWLR